MKKYQVIYADPPWDVGYLKGGKTAGTVGGGRHVPYATMTNKEIALLPVKNITDDNAFLFLWVVDSRIPIVQELMKAWGFKYHGVAFIWNKTSKYDPNKVRATIGTYVRKSCEFCFLGLKGKTSKMLKTHTIKQFANIPFDTLKHSQKPTEIRDKIVMMVGDLPRIELFARQKTEGWDVWGNEVESDIKL